MEAGFGLVQAQSYAPEILKAVERVLDHMPGPLQTSAVGVLDDAVALGRHAHADAARLPVVAQAVAVVSFVAHHGQGCRTWVNASA